MPSLYLSDDDLMFDNVVERGGAVRFCFHIKGSSAGFGRETLSGSRQVTSSILPFYHSLRDLVIFYKDPDPGSVTKIFSSHF